MRYFLIAACLLLPACVLQTVPTKTNQITKANYEKVKMGMTLEEVEKIFERNGEEEILTSTENNVVPEGYQVYLWKTPDPSFVSIAFQDDKVVSKCQVNLRGYSTKSCEPNP
jgi:hypothetical protein